MFIYYMSMYEYVPPYSFFNLGKYHAFFGPLNFILISRHPHLLSLTVLSSPITDPSYNAGATSPLAAVVCLSVILLALSVQTLTVAMFWIPYVGPRCSMHASICRNICIVYYKYTVFSLKYIFACLARLKSDSLSSLSSVGAIGCVFPRLPSRPSFLPL